MMSDTYFLWKFILHPQKIGSITPSSMFLTKRMLENLPWEELDIIVELGAGTGVFSDYIARNKKKSCQVLLVEQDQKMREALQVRYPEFYIGADAEKLPWLLYEYDLAHADCIISGLPFALFTPKMQNQIMRGITECLEPEGIFRACQYSLQMRKIFTNCFREVTIDFEPWNIPPAFVYYCRSPKNIEIKTQNVRLHL